MDKRSIEVRWTGKHVSLNKWYAGEHWSKRNTMKQEWKMFLLSLFRNHPKIVFDKFDITIRHNTRLDNDNMIPVVKFSCDFLKEFKYVTDDTKKYFRKLTIEADESLKKDEIVLVVSDN